MVRSCFILLFLAFLLPCVLCQADVRLFGGPTKYKGRLEVRHSKSSPWGTVCDDEFDRKDAAVVCRMLGLENTKHAVNLSSNEYGPGTGNIILDDLDCFGNETDIFNCKANNGTINCDHDEDVGVNCQTPIRLADGASPQSGRVEIKVNGSWKSFCSDSFSEATANVVCRMLAFSTGNVLIKSIPGLDDGTDLSEIMPNCSDGLEKDIIQCKQADQRQCLTNMRAEINCRTRIRLQDGIHNQSGRVEVYFEDKWNAICDEFFNEKAATVICRMLGFNPQFAKSYGRSRYGVGRSDLDIGIDRLRCSGTETDLRECISKQWGSQTTCDRNRTASVKCATEVRLADGPTSFSGRLEIKSSGSWKPVCDKGFNINAALVVCKMLQFNGISNVKVKTNSYYGNVFSTNIDYQIQCTGNEGDLMDCNRTTEDTDCDTNVGINCYPDTPVRLVGGPTPSSGKVEVYSEEESLWKGICLERFSTNDAVVICKMLGKPNRNPSINRAVTLYHFTIRGNAVTALNCTGNETDISFCRSNNKWDKSNCSFVDFVGINCDPVTPIRLKDGPSKKAGRVEVLFNGTWGSICLNGQTSNETGVMCKMLGYSRLSYILENEGYDKGNNSITINDLNCFGNESDISNCKATPWNEGECTSDVPVGIACGTALRLVNGSDDRSGRVEIKENGTWWTICADTFDSKAANVTCRMAGFRFWNASVLLNSVFGHGTINSIIKNISCRGDEEDLSQCHSYPWLNPTCKSTQVATVHCRIQKTPLRLINGDNPYSGRVEVYHNNKWGTVCEKRFTLSDVKVVCQTAGYNVSSDLSLVIDKYDSGYKPYNVMIRNLTCLGNESDISLCPSSDWDTGYKYCPYDGSYQSVGVNCLTTIKLVGGHTQHSGRVEITHDNQKGTICREGSSKENVKVMCSMLGFNFTNEFVLKNDTLYTLYSTPPVMVDGLKCTGDEIDIQECDSLSWDQKSNCSESQALNINCNTPVNLVNGNSFKSGQVEILSKGEWNNVCYTGNSTQDYENARVICRTMGLSTRKVFSMTTWHNETGHRENQLNYGCQGKELDIGLCQIMEVNCETNISLGITCETDMKIKYGKTKYMGIVSVKLQDTNGVVLNIEDDKTAAVVCRALGHNFTSNPRVLNASEVILGSKTSCEKSLINRLVCDGDESDLIECKRSIWDSPNGCVHPNSGVSCQTPVRLANGSTYQHGRVEFRQNNIWYPVCSKDFTLDDASVICRMLGHKQLKFIMFNEGNVEKHAQYLNGNLQCNGSEDDISQCSNTISEIHCDAGRPIYIDCSTKIRLKDGATFTRGRPEINLNGTWGPICQDSNPQAIKSMCKMLGLHYAGAIKHNSYGSTAFSNITFSRKSYFASNIHCNSYGVPDDISECSSNEWKAGSQCSYTQPLEIECKSPVRLLGGSNTYIGRIRVGFKDSYLGICGDNFTLENADIICKSIGVETYRNATIYYGNKYGYSYNPITDLICLGNETDLQECKSAPWTSSSNCNPSNKAVAVNCRPNTPVRLNGTDSSGLPEFSYRGRWGTICNENFDTKDASVICRMLGFRIGEKGAPVITNQQDVLVRSLSCSGTENDISECKSDTYQWFSYDTSCNGDDQRKASVRCSDDRVSLVGGVNDYIGAVIFQYMGVFGTLCDDGFDTSDAEVVCRDIGIEEKNAEIHNNSRFGQRIRSFVINDLRCTGEEINVDECRSYPWNLNTHSCAYANQNAGVNCRPHTPIRLLDGPSKYTGRLEVEYKGHYGTVCNRGFDLDDATVVCRSLGYNTMSVGFKGNAFYGKGTGDIYISHLECNGDETDISKCNTPHRWAFPYEFCKHEDDVSLSCDTPVRLRGGWTDFEGMVEIYINKTWTPVCYDGFTNEDAKAVCILSGVLDKRQRDVKNITIHKAHYYGIKNNMPSISSLGCNGDEDDLFLCGSGRWVQNKNFCQSHEPVAINCKSTTNIQLIGSDGNRIHLDDKKKDAVSGRIEVFYKNKWGTICDDKFDDTDAFVLCSMLNFTVGKVFRANSEIGYGNGSIWIDDLGCLGIEKDISECKSEEWGKHNCEHTEDVAITCDYIDNIDPCKTKESIRLPNLEVRYANVHTAYLKRAYNDSKLPFRWYNVGNRTFPEKKPQLDRCGTHFPIYSTDKVPGQNKTFAINVTQVSGPNMPIVQYKILAKHCDDGNYVYQLGPTQNELSGYCFGIGSEEKPPDFVAKKVSVRVKTKSASFQCKFDLPSNNANLFYQVHWKITGNYFADFTKQYFDESRLDELDLTDEDFGERDIGLGINITCAIRAFAKPNGQPGALSELSAPYFAGIIVKDMEISLRKGETKSIEVINTIPLICKPNFDSICFLDLVHMIPSDDKCSNLGSFNAQSCQTMLGKTSFNNVTHIKVTTSETGQYGVYGHFKVNLVYNPNTVLRYFDNSILQKRYKLPTINVEVFPEEDRDWRKTICGARNDPHMQTFDNKQYEHHESIGEYILYKHKTFPNVEIQHKIASCVGLNSHAKCNCGVAVRAGSDVYVINVCGSLLDIGYKRCENKALTVKKDNDLTYTIYLPYGTAVRARIDNEPWMGEEGGKVLDISVLPSLHDKDNSTGLCGSLNNNKTDDFENRINGTIHDNTTVNVFINSWKVYSNESLFSNAHRMVLEYWKSPSCMCQMNVDSTAITRCDRSIADCTPGTKTGEHSCGGLASIRTRRSLIYKPNVPIVKQTSHYSNAAQHALRKRSIGKQPTIWTTEIAKEECKQYFDSLTAFKLCSKLPATHTNISVENCVLDIMLSNSTEWIDISRQSMIDTCTGEIHRNATVRKVEIEKAKNASVVIAAGNHTGTNINPQTENKLLEELEDIEKNIKTIKEIACLNNCTGHGVCSNGECVCNPGFGASDCHLDINKPPRIQEILDDGFCDKKDSDCAHIYVFGEVFVGTNLTCRIQTFSMAVNRTREKVETFDIKGTADTLIEAMCPVKHLNTVRKRRSANDESPPAEFAHSYKVSVSNDGVNFGNQTLDAYVFDSTCQTYTNGTMGLIFDLKDGFCHIHGECVKNGTISIHQTMVCNTSQRKYDWTMLPTTTVKQPSTSAASASTGNTTESPLSIVNKIVHSEAGLKSYELELTIGVILDSSYDLASKDSYMKVLDETKAALTDYYQKILGVGLKDIVIISLKKGSLIVEHVVIVKSNEFVTKALSVALANLSSGTQIKLFGKPYGVSNVKIEKMKVGTESDHFLNFLLCESYVQLHPCKEDEVCDGMNGTVSCKKIPQHESGGNTNLFIIISSSVGGVLVIVIFALVVVLCCRRKKSRKRPETRTHVTQQNVYNEMSQVHVSNTRESERSNVHVNPAFDGTSDVHGNDDGSVVEYRGGYAYYYGKKNQEDGF